MENSKIDPSKVKGWGVDANPHNDPTYPMKARNNGEHAGYTWERPTQQPVNVEILHSNERPFVTSVFGTSTPPSGLSGMLRRHAFTYSESSYGHWLSLMAADRISMVGGLIGDLSRGHIPNLPGELGWAAEWKYNRASLVARVIIGAAVLTALTGCLRSRRD